MYTQKVASQKFFCYLRIPFLGAFCHKGEVTFSESRQKYGYFCAHQGLFQEKNFPLIM
jgi:hypothetical protein